MTYSDAFNIAYPLLMNFQKIESRGNISVGRGRTINRKVMLTAGSNLVEVV